MTLGGEDLVRLARARAGSPAERLAGVERDIRAAQAEALGRTGERLQRLLDRLAALDRRLDGPGNFERFAAGRLQRETEVRNRVRDEAIRVRHELIIQREALGLVRATPVEQCYPVPGRRAAPGALDRGRKP